MSLVAWYPLNGNTRNIGCRDANLTTTTAFSFEDSYIGKCAISGAGKLTAAQTAKILNNDAVSFSFWVYPNSNTTGTSALFFGNNGITATPHQLFSLFLYDNPTSMHVSWYLVKSGTLSPVCVFVIKNCFTVLKWNHCAIVYSKALLKVCTYVNGIKVHEYSANYENDNFNFDTPFTVPSIAKFQDFRIYNHVLSEAEIHELSQGLRLHWQCKGPNANENLIQNSFNWNGKTNQGVFKFEGNECIAESAATGNPVSPFLVTLPINLTNISSKLRNKKITISLEYKVDETIVKGSLPSPDSPWVGCELSLVRNTTTGGTSQWLDLNIDKGMDKTASNTWKKAAITYLVTDYDIASSSISFYLRDAKGKIRFRLPKVEVSDHATPWMPCSTDALYSQLGYNSSIEPDCSGFGYDGTKTVSLTSIDSSSPRYNTSVKLESTKCIYNNTFIKTDTVNTPYTISIWHKPDLTLTYTKFTDIWHLLMYNTTKSVDASIRLEVSHPNGIWYTWFGAQGLTDGGIGVHNTTQSWYYDVLSYDGRYLRAYVNGILLSTIDTTQCEEQYKRDLKLNGYFRVGDSSPNMYDSISDARYYATCLSDADIKKLYETSMSIHNNKSIEAYEFEEVPNLTKIKKIGIVNSNLFNESLSASIYSNKMTAQQFIEC